MFSNLASDFWRKEFLWIIVISRVVLTSLVSEQKYMHLQFKKISVVHAKLGLACFWLAFVVWGFLFVFVSFSLQKSNASANVDNPCYPQNYYTALTMKYFFGSLCTESLRPANYYPNQLVNVHGTGDPGLCQEMVSLLFKFTACRDRENCPFNGIQQPKTKGNFVVGLQTRCVSFWACLLLISVAPKVTCHLLLFYRLSLDSTTQLMLWIYLGTFP